MVLLITATVHHLQLPKLYCTYYHHNLNKSSWGSCSFKRQKKEGRMHPLEASLQIELFPVIEITKFAYILLLTFQVIPNSRGYRDDSDTQASVRHFLAHSEKRGTLSLMTRSFTTERSSFLQIAAHKTRRKAPNIPLGYRRTPRQRH